MDITSRRTFWETIRKLASEGKTIILTTHYLEEADVLANRILLFANGKIIADGTPDEMKATILENDFVLFERKIPKSVLKELPNVTEVQSNEGRFILTTEDTDATLQAIYKRIYL